MGTRGRTSSVVKPVNKDIKQGQPHLFQRVGQDYYQIVTIPLDPKDAWLANRPGKQITVHAERVIFVVED